MLKPILLKARAQLRAETQIAPTAAFLRIANETGLTVSWLQKFAYGRINNPTVGSLDRLIAYFDQKEAKSNLLAKIAGKPTPTREVAQA